MMQIFYSLTIILVVLMAIAYGLVTVPFMDPICWKKHPDEPCKTSLQIIKESL